MKKNLISVLILALMVVNIVLTAIMMFSVMGTAKKTGALVTQIAEVLNLELEPSKEGEEGPKEVSIADTKMFDIAEMTIPLRKGEDGKDHYCLISVSIMMDKNHEDFATYEATIGEQESVMKSIVVEAVQSRTMDEAQDNPDALKDDILARLQKAYNSTFIYKVVISSILYQ